MAGLSAFPFGENLLMGAFVETYLDIKGLAAYLGVADKTVRKWVLNRAVPYRKIMKAVRFRLSEIERWIDGSGFGLAEGKQEAADGGLLPGVLPLDEPVPAGEAREEAVCGAEE